MQISYHYRSAGVGVLIVVSLTSCAVGERKLPESTAITVPSVTARPLSVASMQIRDAGLRLDVRASSATGPAADPARCPRALVVAQDPGPGTAEVPGSTVTLVAATC